MAAFPGAEGGGAAARGGRGGQVIEVTNLDDSGPGSLRAALEAEGPRIVVFRVAGIIQLDSNIDIANPYVTVAGQTAPGGGITLRSNPNEPVTPIRVKTHDVVFRYLRVRTGVNTKDGNGSSGIAILAGSHDVMIDHCSTSWADSKNISCWANWSPVIHHVTVQRTIIAEALHYIHGPCGLIVGTSVDASQITNVSIHHNMFLTTGHRTPLFNGNDVKIINNIIYNWEWRATGFGGGVTADIIGNLYRIGPEYEGENDEIAWSPAPAGEVPNYGMQGSPSFYVAGNQGPNQPDPDADNWELIMECAAGLWDPTGHSPSIDFRRYVPLEHEVFPITIQHVDSVHDDLVADSGACHRLGENGDWIWNRDEVDDRVIQDYVDGTGTVPSHEDAVGGFPTIAPGTPYQDSDHDGMPDAWEYLHRFDPNDASDGTDDTDGDGYTNVEEFLNGTAPTYPTATPQPTEPPGEARHVSPSGSSSGDGSEQNPWSLETAATSAQPGDLVLIHDGTYPIGQGLWLFNNGTEEQPITFHAVGQVTFFKSAHDGAMLDVRGYSYLTFEGITFDGDYDARKWTAWRGVAMENTHNITLHDCAIRNLDGRAIYISGNATDIQIDHCTIDLGWYSDGNSHDGLLAFGANIARVSVTDSTFRNIDHVGVNFYSCQDCTIIDNEVHTSHSHLVQLGSPEGAYGWTVSADVRDNNLHGSETYGPDNSQYHNGIFATSSDVQSVTIAFNRIWDLDGSGIHVGNQVVGPVDVHNNTVWGANRQGQRDRAGIFVYSTTALPIHIHNNIVVSTHPEGYTLRVSSEANNQLAADYNLYHSLPGATATIYRHATYYSYPQYDLEPNSLIGVDPLFVDPANGNFELQGESPAIGAGDDYSSIGWHQTE